MEKLQTTLAAKFTPEEQENVIYLNNIISELKDNLQSFVTNMQLLQNKGLGNQREAAFNLIDRVNAMDKGQRENMYKMYVNKGANYAQMTGSAEPNYYDDLAAIFFIE